MSVKMHNAMWPGLVGKKSQGGNEPDISLDRMLELTANANVDGQKFEGVDLFLYDPHISIDISRDELLRLADKIAGMGLAIGSLVAPIWQGTGGGSAMTDTGARQRFVSAVGKACRIGDILKRHGVRKYGVIRIDSADNPKNWAQDPDANTQKIVATFKEAGKIAAAAGERLAAEGEVCWAAMDSWRRMLKLLEAVAMRGVVGLQADMAHTMAYLYSEKVPPDALLHGGDSEHEFWSAYKFLVEKLGPWMLDFHVAQTDGQLHSTGNHEPTSRHCLPDEGKLDIPKCAMLWLEGAKDRGIEHICWDGCMFPNEVLEDPKTWNKILKTMIEVRDAQAVAA
jgi:hypothetical protein